MRIIIHVNNNNNNNNNNNTNTHAHTHTHTHEASTPPGQRNAIQHNTTLNQHCNSTQPSTQVF